MFMGEAPYLLIVLLVPALPPVIGIARGFISIFDRRFMALSLKAKRRAVMLAALLLVLSLGAVAFIGFFAFEIYLSFSCGGAGCYESILGIFWVGFLSIPVTWFSYLLVCAANAVFSRFNLWPRPLQPTFQLYNPRLHLTKSESSPGFRSL
jgi:hypothetical protein